MTTGFDPRAMAEMTPAGEIVASYATVDKGGVKITEDGVELKVTLHPAGAPRTVRLGADYVGPGFGVWTLPKDEDELLCLFPQDGGQGVAIKRLSNSIDKLPKAELDPIKDKNPVVIIHPGGWKLIASDDKITLTAGSVPLEVFGDDVKLGSSAAKALCTEVVHDYLTGDLGTWNAAHTHVDPLSGTTGPPVTPPPNLSGGKTTKVKAT